MWFIRLLLLGATLVTYYSTVDDCAYGDPWIFNDGSTCTSEYIPVYEGDYCDPESPYFDPAFCDVY